VTGEPTDKPISNNIFPVARHRKTTTQLAVINKRTINIVTANYIRKLRKPCKVCQQDAHINTYVKHDKKAADQNSLQAFARDRYIESLTQTAGYMLLYIDVGGEPEFLKYF